jgi:hypothetical protein
VGNVENDNFVRRRTDFALLGQAQKLDANAKRDPCGRRMKSGNIPCFL